MWCGRGALLVLVFSMAAGCERRPLDQRDADSAGQGSAGAIGSAGAAGAPAGGAGGASGAAGSASGGSGGTCPAGGNLAAQCTDGNDNDGDGKIDYDDPECVGGYDNDESSFGWGIPGDNSDPCRTDCFFDGNTGSGDDNCVWQLKCDPANTFPRCPYDAAYAAAYPDMCSLSSSQTQVCVDRCSNRVPNGCDCFGCCAIPGLPGPIRLWPACTAADFGDPQKCPPCTQVTQCLNPCERCEVCIGKPALPDDCATPDGGVPYACPAGVMACGVHGVAPRCCPAGTACVTGCCLPLEAFP
jgi:hypothetical protein